MHPLLLYGAGKPEVDFFLSPQYHKAAALLEELAASADASGNYEAP